MLIAHTSAAGSPQSIVNHLQQTAQMASDFSIAEFKDVNFLSGLLHDVGKYSDAFQNYIRGEKMKVEHSICGAKEVPKFCKNSDALTQLLQLCIAGHHTGIPDCGTRGDTSDAPTLFGRLKRKTENYQHYCTEINREVEDFSWFNQYLGQDCKTSEDVVEKYAFLVRYCFSCLTDADSLDSRRASGQIEPEPLRCDFSACKNSLDSYGQKFPSVTSLQRARNRLQQQALQNVENDAEIYLMNMPTGSGKTLASMNCALRRIEKSQGQLKRILYVIPYNSIIDQTVAVFEQIFGTHTDILRHQSSFIYEEQEAYSEDYRLAAQYACENWDCGIIVTTAVQFFESLYGDKRSKLRKIHNLADSVIVFDEAHLLPRNYLEPCLRGISYIAKYLHSEIFLLTATMPDFPSLLTRYAVEPLRITHLIPDTSDFHFFQKCSYLNLGVIPDELLLQTATKYAASLIVMNTKKGAAELYQRCSGEKYHLSTYMTAYDRISTIDKIKNALTKLYQEFSDLSAVPPERHITVLSTSLIEAGVDLDFVAVFRELSGLDSVLQTGGRCNREGFRKNAQAFIFERPGYSNRIEQELTRGILAEFADISAPEAIRTYYDRLLYVEQNKLPMNAISQKCKKINLIPFRTYSENFRLIENQRLVSIAVCRDTISQELFDRLRATGIINSRRIRKYCCTVYISEFETLHKQSVLKDYGSGVYFLTDLSYYDDVLGIRTESKDDYL